MKNSSIYGDRYGLVSLALVAMLCLFAYTKSTALMWIILGICSVFVLRPDVLFPVMYIASLSGNVFSIESGVSIGRYLSLLFVVSCAFNLLTIKHKSKKSNNYLLAIVVILFTYLSTVLGYDGSIAFFIVMLTNLLVFFLFQNVEKVDINNLINILCISALMGIALLWVFASRDSLFLMSDRFNLEGEANANNLAMMVEQLGAFSIAYVFYGNNKIIRIASIAGAFAALVLVLLTGSRSALIALLAAASLCLILFVRNNKEHKKLGSLLVIFVLLVLGYLFISFIAGIDNPILDRFSVTDVKETGGAGRADNIKLILTKIFPDHFLFGSGIGNANMHALGRTYGLSHAGHNILIDPLTQMGIIGFGIYLFLLIPIIKKYIALIKSRLTICIIIVSVMTAAVVNGIGEVIFYEKFFWCDMAIVALAANQLRKYKLS